MTPHQTGSGTARPHGYGFIGAGLALVILALLLLASHPWRRPRHAAALELSPAQPVVWQDFLGINVHWLWFSEPQRQQQLAALQALGLKWVRLDLHWDRIEPEPGQFRWDLLDPVMQEIASHHLQAEVYLVGSPAFASSAPPDFPYPDKYPPRNPQSYAQALTTLATRYPQVAVWQVWNEPNLPAFWYPHADPQAYSELLKASYLALHRLSPAPQIALGGMAYYSQMPGLNNQLMIPALAEQGLFQWHTIIAYHPYSLYPLGDDPDTDDFVLRAKQANQTLRSAGADQIWADEWGWSSYLGPREEQPVIGKTGQADNLLQRLALISALGYDKVFWFALSDLDKRASRRDQSYGLLDLAGNPKPAYQALARFLTITGPRLLPGGPPPGLTAPAGLVGIGWLRPDGHRLWMFWSDHAFQLDLPALPEAILHSPMDEPDEPQPAFKPRNQRLVLPVTQHLQILEWSP